VAIARNATAPVLLPGDRLDRYELLCAVAEGGMGTVWLARLGGKHGFERLVAIKTILPSYAWDPKFRRMFLDEARIAATIVHPNVAQILDLGEERGILYFVMEWVDGASLRSLVKAVEEKGDVFPTAMALRIAADTCAGLHAAHEVRHPDGSSLGVVHRDVSPQNILITTAGVTKVIDFGIAKARGRAASETATGEIKGKARYMSPEQALGCKVDRRADVWAVGVILYETLTGKPLSTARTPFEAVTELLHGAKRTPLAPHIPAPVATVVERALAPDLDERFYDAAELQHALEIVSGATGLTATTADLAAFSRAYLSDLLAERERFVEDVLASVGRRRQDMIAQSASGLRARVSEKGPDAAPASPSAAPNAGPTMRPWTLGASVAPESPRAAPPLPAAPQSKRAAPPLPASPTPRTGQTPPHAGTEHALEAPRSAAPAAPVPAVQPLAAPPVAATPVDPFALPRSVARLTPPALEVGTATTATPASHPVTRSEPPPFASPTRRRAGIAVTLGAVFAAAVGGVFALTGSTSRSPAPSPAAAPALVIERAAPPPAPSASASAPASAASSRPPKAPPRAPERRAPPAAHPTSGEVIRTNPF